MKVTVTNKVTGKVLTEENVSDVEIGWDLDTITIWTDKGFRKFKVSEVLVIVKEG